MLMTYGGGFTRRADNFQCVSLSRLSAALQVRQQLESKNIFVCSLYSVFCVRSMKVHERLPLFIRRHVVTPKRIRIIKNTAMRT